MNRRFFLLLTLAAAFTGLSSGLRAEDLRAANQTALSTFKTDLEAADTYLQEKGYFTLNSGVPLHVRARETTKKLREVRTAGLPEDLRLSYENLILSVEDNITLYEGWPDTQAEFEEKLKKAMEDPKYMKDVIKRALEHAKRFGEAATKFDEASQKYGLSEVPTFKLPPK